MISRFMTAAAAMLFIFSAVSAFAEGGEPQGTTGPKFSGKLYFHWLKTIDNREGTEEINTFELARAYFTFEQSLNGYLGVHLTLDAANNNGEDTRYQNFIKFAYGKLSRDLGFCVATVRMGMIPGALISLIDNTSDYRWLGNNYIDQSARLLYGNELGDGLSIDYSADLGVGLNIKMANIVGLDLQVTNGNGFKETDEEAYAEPADNSDDGKAYFAMLGFGPLQDVRVAGFFRYHSTLDHAYEGDNYVAYAGAALIYSTTAVKAGITIVMARASTKEETAADGEDAALRRYMLGDSFVNINLMGLVGIPILIAGRFAMGRTAFDEGYGGMDGDEADVIAFAAGIGWQIDDNFRIIAYYEDRNSSSDDIEALDWSDHNRTFYVKSEIRL